MKFSKQVIEAVREDELRDTSTIYRQRMSNTKHKHCYHETCKGDIEFCKHTFKSVNKRCVDPYKICCECDKTRKITWCWKI